MFSSANYVTDVDRFHLYSAGFTPIDCLHTELFNMRDVRLMVYMSRLVLAMISEDWSSQMIIFPELTYTPFYCSHPDGKSQVNAGVQLCLNLEVCSFFTEGDHFWWRHHASCHPQVCGANRQKQLQAAELCWCKGDKPGGVFTNFSRGNSAVIRRGHAAGSRGKGCPRGDKNGH